MPAFRRQWTVDDLQDLPDDGQRTEVIDGELFVTPSPSYDHQAAVAILHRRLAEYLDRERVGYALLVLVDADVLHQDPRLWTVFIVPFVNGRRPRSFDEAKRLLLAAEVLSPSTARQDRVEKRALYREESVAEFWIVDLDVRQRSSDPRRRIHASTCSTCASSGRRRVPRCRSCWTYRPISPRCLTGRRVHERRELAH